MAAQLRKNLLRQYGMPPPESLRPPVPVFGSDSAQGGQDNDDLEVGGHGRQQLPVRGAAQDLSQIPWNQYFEERREVVLNEGKDTFVVFTAGKGWLRVLPVVGA